ncbi:hypothetical protein N658DRAFT_489963 [Parathielavia hyrcaniae]|uniref:Uncharacterized protein n=1 Tax=Parathielavia hyrcaniae TaxID=113614 RepID=A0AAN6SX02_9PEZI|nr:hypothetical protein N658DRAFT_489963 [Parathielavia hyrcaniae]
MARSGTVQRAVRRQTHLEVEMDPSSRHSRTPPRAQPEVIDLPGEPESPEEHGVRLRPSKALPDIIDFTGEPDSTEEVDVLIPPRTRTTTLTVPTDKPTTDNANPPDHQPNGPGCEPVVGTWNGDEDSEAELQRSSEVEVRKLKLKEEQEGEAELDAEYERLCKELHIENCEAGEDELDAEYERLCKELHIEDCEVGENVTDAGLEADSEAMDQDDEHHWSRSPGPDHGTSVARSSARLAVLSTRSR